MFRKPFFLLNFLYDCRIDSRATKDPHRHKAEENRVAARDTSEYIYIHITYQLLYQLFIRIKSLIQEMQERDKSTIFFNVIKNCNWKIIMITLLRKQLHEKMKDRK